MFRLQIARVGAAEFYRLHSDASGNRLHQEREREARIAGLGYYHHTDVVQRQESEIYSLRNVYRHIAVYCESEPLGPYVPERNVEVGQVHPYVGLDILDELIVRRDQARRYGWGVFGGRQIRH